MTRKKIKTITIITASLIIIAAINAYIAFKNSDPIQNYKLRTLSEILDDVEVFPSEILTTYTGDQIVEESANNIFLSELFALKSYLKKDQPEYLDAGTCVLSNRENLIYKDGIKFELSLSNLFNLIKPSSQEEYLEAVNIFYRLEESFCGSELITEISSKYSFRTKEFKNCNKKIELEEERLAVERDVFSFTYYKLKTEQPIEVIECVIFGKIENGIFYNVVKNKQKG